MPAAASLAAAWTCLHISGGDAAASLRFFFTEAAACSTSAVVS
jgi:hypothetical protein